MRYQQLFGVLTAAVMAFSLSSPAFASEEDPYADYPMAGESKSKTVVREYTTPFAGSVADVEDGILVLLNREREDRGLTRLSADKDLQAAARIRSKELYESGTFDHIRPNGDAWHTVIKEDVPVKYFAAGENLCMVEYNDPFDDTATDPSFYMDQWLNSPPRLENIERGSFTHVGVGVYVVKEENGWTHAYATTIFAKL